MIRGRALAVGFLLVGLVFVSAAAPLRTARAADDFEEAKKAFHRDSKTGDAKARAHAYRAIGAFDRPETVEEIVAALAKDESGLVAKEAIKALQWLEKPASVEAIGAASRSKTGWVRLCMMVVLSEQRGAPASDALLEALQAKDPQVVAQAALAAGKRKVAAALPALKGLLASEDPRVRAAAARGIAAMPSAGDPKDLMPALAAALAASSGRERTDIVNALRAVSKLKYDADPEAWKKVAAGAASSEITPKPETPAYLAGIPLLGRRVVIVVDNSQRSEDGHPFQDKERLKALCQVPGARPVPWYDIRTIRQFEQAHARRACLDLPKGAAFDVIAVGGKPKALFGKLSPAGDAAKKSVEDFLGGLKGENDHDDIGALTLALDLGGKKDTQAWASGPDEIVYITCQGPWRSTMDDALEVGATIGLRARFRMVPVHTVGVGAHSQEYLRSLADLSGGTYVDLSR